jgi:general secretion pathway protein G
VEVLVAMAIVLVLAGLILATSSYLSNKGGRSRAEVEIAAMSAALENYKADNGVYPSDTTIDARTTGDPVQYQTASATLFKSLSGDLDGDGQSDLGVTSYMVFKPNQTGGTVAPFFVKDPFGNSYGYSTIFQIDSTKGYNSAFDLWSTAGTSTTGTPNPVPWIKNW